MKETKRQKQPYVLPECKEYLIKFEGVMCASDPQPDTGDNWTWS